MYHVYFHVSRKFKFQKKKLFFELCSTSDPKKEKQNCVLVVWAMFCLFFPINVYLEVTGL